MKKKMKSRLIAAVISLTMAFTMIPIMGAPVYAASKSSFYLGADVLKDGSNTSEAATVHMAGTKWLVIGYGVSQEGGITQVASSADTMTLISVENLAHTRFNNKADSNYKDSLLHKKIEDLNTTDAIIKSFSKEEKEGIVPRDLEPGEYIGTSPYTNGIGGDEVKGALLWPLSTQEACYMNVDLRKADPEHPDWAESEWWLRSPGPYNTYAAYVPGNGGETNQAYSIYIDEDVRGVRPAFNIDLKSVIFTSAAVGGKSDTTGVDSLKPVETNSTDEWKLTIKDEKHAKFALDDKKDVTYDSSKNLLTIPYKNAAAGEGEYLSAIVTDSTGKTIKRYGHLERLKVLPFDKTVSVKLGDDLEPGDRLCVFYEQCNEDKRTDYASEPVLVYTAPSANITKQPGDLDLTYGDTAGNVLSVEAEAASGNALSYQWYVNTTNSSTGGTPIANATSDAYAVPTDENVGKTLYYYCAVTDEDEFGARSETTNSTPAAVTVNKAKLTIKPKDQTFTYNGQKQGPADAVYENPSAIYVDAEGIADGDILDSVTIDGQRKEAGTSDLTITGCMVRNSDGEDVRDNYNIEYVSGKLIIDKANITITADDKSSKAGEALKELTYKVSGAYVEGDDLGITVSTDANKDKAGTYNIKVDWNNNKNYEATLVNGKYTVTAVPIPTPPAPKTSGTPLAKAKAKKKSMTLGWYKIEGAEGYDIFFATCNHSHKKIACKNVKTIKGNKTFKWTKSGLKKGTAYKFYVRAYVTKNGKKTYVSKSPIMHAYTGNGTKKYTNAKSVKLENVKKGKLTLNKGKTFKIKAKVKKISKKKKLMPKSHAPTLRYMTSNSKVATVSKSGKISAKGSGTCYIYVYAHNGVARQVKVTIKQ